MTRLIPGESLTLKDIPSIDAGWQEIGEFALTFDGYSFNGFDRCAEISNERRHESLSDLRTCLFFEQRRWHHFGDVPNDASMAYIRELVLKIRNAVAMRAINDGRRVWRLVAHHKAPEEALRWFAQSGVVAMGWGKVGDVSKAGFKDAKEIGEALHDAYPHLSNFGAGGACLFKFWREMGRGDLVIVSDGKRRVLVMEVDGDYEFSRTEERQPIGDYQHRRRAKRVEFDANELWIAAGSGPSDDCNIRWTLIECSGRVKAAETSGKNTGQP